MNNAANCARLMNTEEQQVQSLISQLSCILVRRIKMRSTEGVDHDREVQTSLKSAGLVSRTQSDVIDVNLSNARSDAPPQSIQDTRLKSISQSVSQSNQWTSLVLASSWSYLPLEPQQQFIKIVGVKMYYRWFLCSNVSLLYVILSACYSPMCFGFFLLDI